MIIDGDFIGNGKVVDHHTSPYFIYRGGSRTTYFTKSSHHGITNHFFLSYSLEFQRGNFLSWKFSTG